MRKEITIAPGPRAQDGRPPITVTPILRVRPAASRGPSLELEGYGASMHDLERGRIAVTGGAGLIGSGVIWALNRRGLDNILVVDRLDCSEKWRHLVPLALRRLPRCRRFRTRERRKIGRRRYRDDHSPRRLFVDDRARLPTISFATTSSTRRVWRIGRCQTTRASCMRRRPQLTAAWNPSSPTKPTFTRCARSTVCLLEAAFRPVREAAATRRTHLRAQILQRLRAQRRAQGRDAQHRAEGLRADSRARQRPALQELSLRVSATASSSATSSTSRMPSK